jgi:hypothetical protein
LARQKPPLKEFSKKYNILQRGVDIFSKPGVCPKT